ncbi:MULTISPECIES: response regulator [unclassified Anabaena]|uniref:response regulator n=1 Tax=unclassified Anabaena TaxID=2619674 RepID=UPI001446CFBB|nr:MULTISPECIES: response regulator [unclassified Anabaena]MTJ07234.1 response regulator [Anabaena sp. UHCC 0204]MTJ55215.1 response regulator [Anabaena sp. UHCC 0253]
MNKILVVENETVLLGLLAELLDLYGFIPITTTSLKQGYELTKLENPHLILCGYSSQNINNSDETCWTFLQKIRQDLETANIPFILMTGAELETIPNWQNYLRFQDILLKPFNSQVLLEKIHAHLSSYQIKSKTNQNHQSSDSREFTNQNAFFTKENQTTYNYSYLLA